MWLFDLSRGRAWKDVGLFLFLALGLETVFDLVFFPVMGVPEPGAEESESYYTIAVLSRLAYRAAAMIFLVTVLLRNRGQTFASVGLRKRKVLADVLLGLPTMVFAYALVVMVLNTLALIWPAVFRQMDENMNRLDVLFPALPVLGYACLAAAVGFYEELVFRGFLMTRLRRATGGWTGGVLLSTLIFTALHALEQTPSALVAVTILSLTFSAVTILRRSIIPAVVAHALFDFVQFVSLDYLMGGRGA